MIAAVVQDITARHAAELELRGREAENRRLATEQGALRRVATAVAQEDDPQAAFDLVCEEAVRLLGAASGGPGALRGGRATATRMGAWGVGGRAAGVRATGERLDGDGLAAHGARAPAAPRASTLPGETGAAAWRSRRRCARATACGARSACSGRSTRRAMPDAAERLGRFAELVGIAVSNAEARARLAALAATDHLTGLANHRTFQERLAQEVVRASPPRPPLLAGAARHRPLQARERRPGPPGGRRRHPRDRPAAERA